MATLLQICQDRIDEMSPLIRTDGNLHYVTSIAHE
jgi:hypothetical protein